MADGSREYRFYFLFQYTQERGMEMTRTGWVVSTTAALATKIMK